MRARLVRRIAEDALSLIAAHRWPGNVRELKNAIERAVVITEADIVGVDDLPLSLALAGAPGDAEPRSEPIAETGLSESVELSLARQHEDFKGKMDRLEAEVLLEALRASSWNQTQAARRLQMPLRTLVHKMKVHQLRKLGFGPPSSDPSGTP